jgi:hypothetical protein
MHLGFRDVKPPRSLLGLAAVHNAENPTLAGVTRPASGETPPGGASTAARAEGTTSCRVKALVESATAEYERRTAKFGEVRPDRPNFPRREISVRGKVPIRALSAYTDLPPSHRRRRPAVPPPRRGP